MATDETGRMNKMNTKNKRYVFEIPESAKGTECQKSV